MTEYYLMVAVDGDDAESLGYIKAKDYEDWNNGDIDTGAKDHCSLFNSEYVVDVGTLQDALDELAMIGGKITGVKGAIMY